MPIDGADRSAAERGLERPAPAGPVTVLYLGGQARSGSTLLDRALGQIPGFCSAGEVRYLWDRGLVENQRCGCGLPLRECPFWTAVGAAAFGGWDRIDLGEVLALQASVDRVGAMGSLMLPSRAFRSRLDRYGDYVGRAFRAIGEVSGARVVIDSSMSPPHGLMLRRMRDLDLRIVHLVRDARGVAFSSAKQVERPEVTSGAAMMPTYSPAQAAARWDAANVVFELLGARIPYLRVRYETFVREPRRELKRVAELTGVGLGPKDLSFVTDAQIDLAANHTAAGNPMRFKVGSLPFRVDEAWRDDMPASARRLVTAATWPLLRRYGYVPDRWEETGP